jgi:hypothetical protein
MSPRPDKAFGAPDIETGDSKILCFPFFPTASRKPPLDAPRQLILPFGAGAGILARHLEVAVAGDLRCLEPTHNALV